MIETIPACTDYAYFKAAHEYNTGNCMGMVSLQKHWDTGAGHRSMSPYGGEAVYR